MALGDAAEIPAPDAWGVTRDEAAQMLRSQVCPACGKGPWRSVLNHASRKHGIDRFTMRDICGLTTAESVVEPELRERFAERGRAADADWSAMSRSRKNPGENRWTTAGRERNAATLARWVDANPDAAQAQRAEASRKGSMPEGQAKRVRTLAERKPWETWTDEERARRAAALHTPEAEAARVAARERKRQSP